VALRRRLSTGLPVSVCSFNIDVWGCLDSTRSGGLIPLAWEPLVGLPRR